MTATRRRTGPLREDDGLDRWLVAGLALVVVLPIAVAVVRTVGEGWAAVGDNANFLIRSRDVLTAHHPLLGTWSSASLSIGRDVNHPGPLMFDLLAPGSKLGGAPGMAVSTALVNVAAVAAAAVVAHRIGGLRAAAVALLTSASVIWAMGSELLFDPWNPHVVLLPLVLLLVLVWAMVRGFAPALPAAAFVASLVVQTHLSYALLVPALCLWGVVWLVRAVGLAGLRRTLVTTAVVLGLAWVQPLVDQVAGNGNLGDLASSAGASESSVGASLGLRLVADVVATPPWWGRHSFADAVQPPPGQPPLLDGEPNIDGLPSPAIAVAALAVVTALLALAWVVARRRDPVARAGVGVAAVALVLATGATVTLPIGLLGVSPHQVRHLWPVAALVTATVALVLVRRTAVLVVAAVALSLLSLPRYDAGAGPADDADVIPALRALTSQLGTLEDEGTLLYDTSRLRFAEPWTSSVMAALQERGIDFVVREEGWARQLGTRRRWDGRRLGRIYVLEGDAAREVPPGSVRVAHVDGLTPEERDELAHLERRLADLGIRLNADGRAARDVGALRSFEERTPTADELIATGELSTLVRERLLHLPRSRQRAAARYADLRYRWDRHTVAVLLEER